MSEELEKSPMIYKNGQMSPRSMKVLGKELDMPKDIGDKESDISEALDDDEHDVSEKSDDEDLDISEETEDKVDSNGTRTLSRHNVLTRIYASESDCIAISATGYVYYLVPSRQFLPPPLLFQSSLATKGARKTSNRSPSRPTWSYRLELPSLASQAALSPHNNLTVLDIKNRICSLDTYYRFRVGVRWICKELTFRAFRLLPTEILGRYPPRITEVAPGTSLGVSPTFTV